MSPVDIASLRAGSPGAESAGQISVPVAVQAHPETGGKSLESLAAAGFDVSNLGTYEEESSESSVCESESESESEDEEMAELSTDFFLSNPSVLVEIFDAEPSILENCLSADPTLLQNYMQAKPAVLRELFEKNSSMLFYYLSNNMGKLGQFFDACPESLANILSMRGMNAVPESNGQVELTSHPSGDKVCVAGVSSDKNLSEHPRARKTPSKLFKSSDNISTTVKKDAEMFGCYPSDSEAPKAKAQKKISTTKRDVGSKIEADKEAHSEESDEDIVVPGRRKTTTSAAVSKPVIYDGPRELLPGKCLPKDSTANISDTTDFKDDAADDSNEQRSDAEHSDPDTDVDEYDEYENSDSDVDTTPARALIPYPAPRNLVKASKLIKAGKSWRLFEEDLAIGHMLDIRDENEIHGENRFHATSERLLAVDEIKRSWGAVKNFWNRTGRARSGFDERKNKKAPLATSRQGKHVQKKRKAAEDAQRQNLAQSSKVSSLSESRIHSNPCPPSTKSSTTIKPTARKDPVSSSTQEKPTEKPSARENFIKPSIPEKPTEMPSARKKTVAPATRKVSTTSHSYEESPAPMKPAIKKAILPTPKSTSMVDLKKPTKTTLPASASKPITEAALQKMIADAQAKTAEDLEKKFSAILTQQAASMSTKGGSKTLELQHTTKPSSKKRSRITEENFEDGKVQDEPAAKKSRPSPIEVNKVKSDRYGPDPASRRQQYHEMTKIEKFYSDARRPSPRKRDFSRSEHSEDSARGYNERRDDYRPRDDYSDRYDNHNSYRRRSNDYHRRDYDNGRGHGYRY